MLKVYGFSRVNALARGNTRDLRVLWALEELQMPFELVGLDHPAHELDTDAYRALSPFAQIPSIDDDGVVLSESVAILLYLAKKTEKLTGSYPLTEAQVVRWCLAAVSTVEFPLLNIALIDFGMGGAGKSSAYREEMVKLAQRLLDKLDTWLDGRAFVATDTFTVADIAMAHVLDVIKDESLLAPHERVRSYLARCTERPAWRRTIDSYNARVEAA